MNQNCSKISDFLRRQLILLRNLGWNEVILLVAALFVACCGYCFVQLADEVNEGDTQTIDEWILQSLRRADDPTVPIGPVWITRVEPRRDSTWQSHHIGAGLVRRHWIHVASSAV
jgi:hypothetical protein